jgi:hypothetical protein
MSISYRDKVHGNPPSFLGVLDPAPPGFDVSGDPVG